MLRIKDCKPEVGTFGSAEEFPVLECIIDQIKLLDAKQRIAACRVLNKINDITVLCNKIPNVQFRMNVKRKFEKDYRDNIRTYFTSINAKLATHMENFVHAKFNSRDELKQHIQDLKNDKLRQQKQSAIKDVKLPKFYIFGSKSSQDYDVICFPDALLSIAYNAQLCKKYEYVLEDLFEKELMPKKKVNVNLGFINDGSIIHVHKGTFDEVNNSVMATYHNHRQFHPLNVKYEYTRGGADNQYTHLKVKRCLRFILSFFSRVPELRPFVKPALKGNVNVRLDALLKIDLTKHKNFEGKKEKVEDIYKVLAFQLAQTHLLIQGKEIFSKEEAFEQCPEFYHALKRQPLTEQDLEHLQDSLIMLIANTKNIIPFMESLDEPIFNT